MALASAGTGGELDLNGILALISDEDFMGGNFLGVRLDGFGEDCGLVVAEDEVPLSLFEFPLLFGDWFSDSESILGPPKFNEEFCNFILILKKNN